ncbi:MAG: STN domain-containing protein [Thiobacillus sp.]
MKNTLAIALLSAGLTGCANFPGLEGQRAMQGERPENTRVAPLSAPTQAVRDAILEAARDPGMVVTKPTEPRFNLNVNQAKAHEVFLGMANGTPWSMMVHPDVSGTLTLDLKSVTVPEAMESIRALYGYDYEIQGRRIIVPSPAV